MPRRPRLSTGGVAYHVLNRRVGRLELFDKPADDSAFEESRAEVVAIRCAIGTRTFLSANSRGLQNPRSFEAALGRVSAALPDASDNRGEISPGLRSARQIVFHDGGVVALSRVP